MNASTDSLVSIVHVLQYNRGRWLLGGLLGLYSTPSSVLLLLLEYGTLGCLIECLQMVLGYLIVRCRCRVVSFPAEHWISRLTDAQAKGNTWCCQKSFTPSRSGIRRSKTTVNRQLPHSRCRSQDITIVKQVDEGPACSCNPRLLLRIWRLQFQNKSHWFVRNISRKHLSLVIQNLVQLSLMTIWFRSHRAIECWLTNWE